MQSYRALGIAVAGSLVGLAILYIAGGFREDYVPTMLIIVLTGAILSHPISKVLTGQTPWYGPHAFALAALAMTYVAAPSAVLIFRMKSEFYGRELAPEEFQRAVFWSMIGVASYLVGFRFGPKRTYFNRGVEWYFADTPSVLSTLNTFAIALWIMGMLAWSYMFFVIGGGNLASFGTERGQLIGGAGGIIYHIAKFAYVGTLLYFARNGINPLSVVMIASFGLFLLIFGSRSFVAILLLGALIVYRYRFTNRIPLIVWGATGLAMFLVMGFLAALRATKNVGQAVQVYQSATSTIEGKVLSVVGYFDFVVPMAEVINNMGGKIPYQYGRTLGQILYFIPSFIWKGQYMFTSASQVYTSSLFPNKAGQVTLTPALAAEFYMNFGGPGVIFGFMFMGVFIRWLQSRMLDDPRRRYQFAWIVFSALVSVNMVRVFKNGFGTLVFMFYFFVPLAACYFSNLKFLFSPPPGRVPPVLDLEGNNIEDDALLFAGPEYATDHDEQDDLDTHAHDPHHAPAH